MDAVEICAFNKFENNKAVPARDRVFHMEGSSEIKTLSLRTISQLMSLPRIAMPLRMQRNSEHPAKLESASGQQPTPNSHQPPLKRLWPTANAQQPSAAFKAPLANSQCPKATSRL